MPKFFLITVFILSLFFNFNSLAFAQGSGATSGTSGVNNLGPGPAGRTQLTELVQRIINISVGIAFVALTAILFIAGVKFLTSGGDPKTIQSAQQTITWALLGCFFLALAWVILLLIRAGTGVDVTKFTIGFPDN